MSQLSRSAKRSHKRKGSFALAAVSFDKLDIPSPVTPRMKEVYHISDSGRSPTSSPRPARRALAPADAGRQAADDHAAGAASCWGGEEHQRSCWHEVLNLPRLDKNSVKIKVEVHKLIISGVKPPDGKRTGKGPIRFQRNVPIPADVASKSVRTTWLSPEHLQVFGMKRKYCDRKTFIRPHVKTRGGPIKRLKSYTGHDDVDSSEDEVGERPKLKRQGSAFEGESYYKTLHFPENLEEEIPYKINAEDKTVTFQLNIDERKTLVLPKDVDASTISVQCVDKRKMCIYALKESPFLGYDEDSQDGRSQSANDIKKQARKRALESTFLLGSLDSDTTDSSSDEEGDVPLTTRTYTPEDLLKTVREDSSSTDHPSPDDMEVSDTVRDARGSDGSVQMSSKFKQQLSLLHTAPPRVASGDTPFAASVRSPDADVAAEAAAAGGFQLCLDVSGYLPHEITIKVTRGTVLIAGYHEEQHGRESMEYQFRRRLDLNAAGADHDKLEVIYEEDNRMLKLTAPLKN